MPTERVIEDGEEYDKKTHAGGRLETFHLAGADPAYKNLHRLNGPALTRCNSLSNFATAEWWVDGVFIGDHQSDTDEREERFAKAILKYKLKQAQEKADGQDEGRT